MKTIISNLFDRNGAVIDLVLKDGLIEDICPPSENYCVDAELVDGAGYIVIPPMVDAHVHLDKTVLGMDWFVNDLGGSLLDCIDNERSKRKTLGLDPYRQAKLLLEKIIAAGTLSIRTHVDIDTVHGLSLLAGVKRALADYQHLIKAEIVAFPQSGLLIRDGSFELMAEALEQGATVVGGLDPSSFDRDPVRSINMIFKLAEKYGKPIDIHLHERGELGAFTISLIAQKTISCGLQGRVSLSHAFCLGSEDKALVSSILDDLAKADINIITAGQPQVKTIPQIRDVQAAGVLICGGNDNIRDMWSPFGSGDMLERAMFIAMKNYFHRDTDLALAFDVCSKEGARLTNTPYPGIVVGAPADFVLVKARSIAEVVATHPSDRLVFKAGKMIAQDMRLIE